MVESQHCPFLPDGKGADIQEGGDPPVLLRPAITPPRVRGGVIEAVQSGGSHSLCSHVFLFVSVSSLSSAVRSSGISIVGICALALSSLFMMRIRFLLLLVSFSMTCTRFLLLLVSFSCSMVVGCSASFASISLLCVILSFSSFALISFFFLLFTLCVIPYVHFKQCLI